MLIQRWRQKTPLKYWYLSESHWGATPQQTTKSSSWFWHSELTMFYTCIDYFADWKVLTRIHDQMRVQEALWKAFSLVQVSYFGTLSTLSDLPGNDTPHLNGTQTDHLGTHHSVPEHQMSWCQTNDPTSENHKSKYNNM